MTYFLDTSEVLVDGVEDVEAFSKVTKLVEAFGLFEIVQWCHGIQPMERISILIIVMSRELSHPIRNGSLC